LWGGVFLSSHHNIRWQLSARHPTPKLMIPILQSTTIDHINQSITAKPNHTLP
jgi:hypothetical protein